MSVLGELIECLEVAERTQSEVYLRSVATSRAIY
jgi:hypothetical protein